MTDKAQNNMEKYFKAVSVEDAMPNDIFTTISGEYVCLREIPAPEQVSEDNLIVFAQQYALDKCQDNMGCLTKVLNAFIAGYTQANKFGEVDIKEPSKQSYPCRFCDSVFYDEYDLEAHVNFNHNQFSV